MLFCPWIVLSILVPSFTKKESRSCLDFLLIKILLSTSFEILSLNSTSLKFAGFLVICSIIYIVSGRLDFFLMDLTASKIISLTCSLTILSTVTFYLGETHYRESSTISTTSTISKSRLFLMQFWHEFIPCQ